MNEKRRKAEMLLESIGEIDDIMLEEALAYRGKTKVNMKIIALAASFALVFTLVAGNALIKRITDMMAEGDAPGVSDTPNDGDEATPSDPDRTLTLDSVFENLSSSEGYEYVTDPDTLPYHDGNVYIVWRYSGEERYFISDPLENSEVNTIKNSLGGGKETGIASPTLGASVWVLLGDGRVISPYLKASNGNISAEIFDYEVEIIPNEDLARRIQIILG